MLVTTIVSVPGGMTRVDDHNDLPIELGIQSCFRSKIMLEGNGKASKWIKGYVSRVTPSQKKVLTDAMGVCDDDDDALVEVMKREAECNFFVMRNGTTFRKNRPAPVDERVRKEAPENEEEEEAKQPSMKRSKTVSEETKPETPPGPKSESESVDPGTDEKPEPEQEEKPESKPEPEQEEKSGPGEEEDEDEV